MLFNERGEVAGAEPPKSAEPQVFKQEDVDRIVQERLARERTKFSDYDDLRKFREEHSKKEAELQQQDLIRQKKYEEAEGTYKKQLTEREQLLVQKDQQIQDMRISNALTFEISKQNGFVEETVALLRNSAAVSKDGAVLLKMRDTNGIEKEVTIEEGLKQFYAARPHLLRATGATGGSGTPPAGSGGGAGAGDDLASLNMQLVQAMSKGDRKAAEEITKKIRTHPSLGNRNAL
jgi:hypothetical protein